MIGKWVLEFLAFVVLSSLGIGLGIVGSLIGSPVFFVAGAILLAAGLSLGVRFTRGEGKK